MLSHTITPFGNAMICISYFEEPIQTVSIHVGYLFRLPKHAPFDRSPLPVCSPLTPLSYIFFAGSWVIPRNGLPLSILAAHLFQ